MRAWCCLAAAAHLGHGALVHGDRRLDCRRKNTGLGRASRAGWRGLVIAGAGAEPAARFARRRQNDATAGRPLPSGRLRRREVTWFGLIASAAGLAYLAVLCPPAVVVLTAVSWLLYVWVYTPLKSRTAWQTPVGAVAGAMPVLLGAAAVGALGNPMAWTLLGIVFCWQLPMRWPSPGSIVGSMRWRT